MKDVLLISINGLFTTFVVLGSLGFLVFLMGILLTRTKRKMITENISRNKMEKSEIHLTQAAVLGAVLYLLEEEKENRIILPGRKQTSRNLVCSILESSRRLSWR